MQLPTRYLPLKTENPNMNIENAENIIKETNLIIKDEFNKIVNLLTDKNLIELYLNYKEHNSKKKNFVFNIFEIISELYYRENFHSDIIAFLLDVNQKHYENDNYLKQFIILLNNKFVNKINILDFQNSNIYREKGKIDILIKDDTTKKAIIIENKINNAGDQPRQIPRYHKYIKDTGYETIAVVYLTLSGFKSNTFADWTDKEIAEIEPKIIKINAYDETNSDLLNGWLKPCELITKNIDALCILRQYSKLIQNLGGQNMNKQIMDKFYDLIKDNEKYQTIISIQEMIQNIPHYLTLKFKERFENNPFPFKSILIWQGKPCAYLHEFFYENANFAIDIWSYETKINITFFDRNYDAKNKNQAQVILQKIKMDNEFNWNDARFEKNFMFPSNIDDCFIFLDNLVNKLKSMMKKGS